MGEHSAGVPRIWGAKKTNLADISVSWREASWISTPTPAGPLKCTSWHLRMIEEVHSNEEVHNIEEVHSIEKVHSIKEVYSIEQ